MIVEGVIAVDTNILVYAHREDSSWHASAERVVRRLAEGTAIWAVPWPCIHEFLAISTHPRIYDPPSPIPRALDQVDAWLESPSLTLLHEAPGYMAVLRQILAESKVEGGAVHDARVAALCEFHGVHELLSADRDFNRFRRLRTRNPLIA